VIPGNDGGEKGFKSGSLNSCLRWTLYWGARQTVRAMAEVIMGMYQEMVVLREQAKPLMSDGPVAVSQSPVGQTKKGIQMALHNSELGAHERRRSLNVVPCQSSTDI
jgi:hypothetical protein